MTQNTGNKRKGVDLTRLANASKGLEEKPNVPGTGTGTGTEGGNEPPYTTDLPEETPIATSQDQPSKAFLSYMVENPKFTGTQRKSVPMAGDLHAKVSKVAAAEKTDIIVLTNNIVDAWLKKYAADCKKSVDRANSIFG